MLVAKLTVMQTAPTWQGRAEAARAVLRVLHIGSTHQSLTPSITMVYGIKISIPVFKLGSESLSNAAKVTQLAPGKDFTQASLTPQTAS